MGVWFFAIGFGPIGFLLLGAAATALGVGVALAISGGLLLAATAGLWRFTNLNRLM
jgi:hypothetical protein